LLYLVGTTREEMAGSHYAEVVGRDMFEPFFPYAAVPQVDIAHAYDTMKALGSAIRRGLVCSCHDLSEGGLAVALAEMAIAGSLGVRVDLGNLPPCISDKGGIAFQLPQGGIAEREQLHKNDETSRSGFQVPERMMHEVERGLDLVAAIGLTTEDLDLVLHVPSDARTHIDDLLASYHVDKPSDRKKCRGDPCGRPARGRPAWGRPAWGRPALIVVHPGCSMPARTYPWEMYVEVVDLLVEQLGATVFLTGAEDEQELVERILSQVQEGNRRAVHSLAGVLSFPALCALIEAADLVITNNTGPMHISAAVKTPVVALFALTNPPEQWGPWHVPHRLLNVDVPCRICYSRVCPYQHECLRLVSPSMVVDAASGLLKHLGRELTAS
ncbi:MAG: glycosyltransferase family 9 protein, partial [Ktedonobacteraceae bacterium]